MIIKWQTNKQLKFKLKLFLLKYNMSPSSVEPSATFQVKIPDYTVILQYHIRNS